MNECKSCGGRYEPIQADGSEYYHACPPLSLTEFADAVERGEIKLARGQKVGEAYLSKSWERADKRDENVTGPPAKDGEAPPIKARGKGSKAL